MPPRHDPTSSTANALSTIGCMGIGFVALFAIALLSGLFLMRDSIREAQGVLDQDLQRTIRRYNRPVGAGPRVGLPAGGQLQLELDQRLDDTESDDATGRNERPFQNP